MTPAELLVDAFDRILHTVDAVLDGLSDDELAARPGPDANSIAWLVWHLARGQDAQVADVAGVEQVWTARDFVSRFDLPLDRDDTGYGHTSDEVAAVRASGDLLSMYLHAVHDQTMRFLDGMDEADLDRVVDKRWKPPVTLGVRLVSVLNDDAQHAGQAAYAKGLVTSAGQ